MKLLRKAVWISALSSVLALITSSTAVAGVTTPVRASALASPLAACASQDGAQIAATGGRNYLNAEVEPTLGVYGNHLIGQWHEDRWPNAQPIPGSAFTQFAQSTDKNSTTADPRMSHAGTAYTVWDTLIEPTDNPDDNPHTSSYTGPAYFSKTTDYGAHWSQAKVIIDTKVRQQTIGNIIVVDPRNGTMYDFTNLIVSPNTPRQGTRSNALLAFVKSTDGGDTWTQPQVIAPLNQLGVIDPNTGEHLRTGDVLFSVAISGDGNLYATWQASTNYQKQLKQSVGNWDDQIVFARSTDGGQTWSGPTVIHTASGLPTFTPTIAVNNGTIAVTYYDVRFLTPNQTTNLPTDYWVEYSTNGGASFGNEQRITQKSFDARTAPVARG